MGQNLSPAVLGQRAKKQFFGIAPEEVGALGAQLKTEVGTSMWRREAEINHPTAHHTHVHQECHWM